jgi:hypothetical protein
LDRSSDNHTDQNEPSGWRPPPRARAEVKKDRETKEDGRYIIFYEFGDEGAEVDEEN